MIEKKVGTLKSFDGSPIYYELRGSGPALIFIYGIACQMNHWHHQISYFSKSHTVLTFDLRGHHKSNPIAKANDISIYDIAKDVDSLMKQLQIQKADFVGHSFGTTVILALFELFPERIISATFVNGFSRNPIKNMFGTDLVEKFYYFIKNQYEHNSDIWNTIWRSAIENPLSMYLAGLVGGFNLRLTQFKDIEVYARGVSRMDLHIFFQLFEELMRYHGELVLTQIKVPVLVISGESDTVTPFEFQMEFQKLIPHCVFVSVPYGSHCTQLDFPDYFNLKLQEFLQSSRSLRS